MSFARAIAPALLAVIPFAHSPSQGLAETLTIPLVYLRAEVDRPPVLSNLDPVPGDLGFAGAEIALADTKTTGQFLGHSYSLTLSSVPPGGDLLAAAQAALATSPFLLIEADPAQLLSIADLPQAQAALLFNVASGAASLRGQDCRANLLHTAPEDAARSDALMQVLQAQQWSDLAMIIGPNPTDASWAATLRASATKFGLTLHAEKTWTFDTDLRESTLQEIPRFTQDLPDHDVLLVADATDDFGRYIEHHTWLPRPVAGSEGMIPTAWSPMIEAWGAVQLQNRFKDHAARPMRGQDYAAWAAIRAVGEAVTRTNSTNPATLRSYLLGPDFELDGFKGRGLSFRPWNGQLRQPIAVANDRALITLAPLPGFLHQTNEMDTLGQDRPESPCTAFGG